MSNISPEYAHSRVNLNNDEGKKVKTLTKKQRQGNYDYIPEPVADCIDFLTHTEGWKTGLNDVILVKHDQFKSYLIMSGATVKPDGDVYVPAIPNVEGSARTQIGMGYAVNVSDLNIFFGRLQGHFGIPDQN